MSAKQSRLTKPERAVVRAAQEAISQVLAMTTGQHADFTRRLKAQLRRPAVARYVLGALVS